MQRRYFITLLGGAAATVPMAARAQQPGGRVYRVGYLAGGSLQTQFHSVKAFEDGLRSLGYRVGQNLVIEYRFADGEVQRIPALVADLVRLGVEVIVSGNSLTTAAAMKATSAIPIVMTTSADPVSAGFVASLARPGGNVTGFSLDGGNEGEMQAKRLGLLKEILPNLTRVGILWNPDGALDPNRLESMKDVSQPLGLKLVVVEARGLDTLEKAFATMAREQIQAFIVVSDTVLFNYRQQIGVMALKNRLPSTSSLKEFAEAGLLLSYGPEFEPLYRGAAVFIDKIFKGATAADLPVELPTKFELVINLKTAKTIGIEVPSSLLLRADLVIE
jgi:putative ABC transport system substrate-binding protein